MEKETKTSAAPMSKPKEQDKEQTNLYKYRLSVVVVIAAVLFLLGVTGMTLNFGDLEGLIFNNDTVRSNPVKLEKSANPAAYLVRELSEGRVTESLMIGEEYVTDLCTEVKEAEVISLQEVDPQADGSLVTDVYNADTGLTTAEQSPRTYEVSAVIECEDAEGNTFSDLAEGQISVLTTKGEFSIEELVADSTDSSTGTFLEGEAPDDVDPSDLAAQ